MMERLALLADARAALDGGAAEYFNGFFDFFPDQPPLPENAALTPGEHSGLTAVLALMAEAADATPVDVTDAALVASGWPERIASAARAALAPMEHRGRFSEAFEEPEPGVGPQRAS
jgi:hypothetical protein